MSIGLVGIASGYTSCTDLSLTVLNLATPSLPYPTFVVYCSGLMPGFESQIGSLKNGDIRVAACAVPTGAVQPTSALNMITGYMLSSDNKMPTMNPTITSTYTAWNTTQINQACMANNTFIHFSGNSVYNIYATHVLSNVTRQGSMSVLGYGNLVSGVQIRSSALSPAANDVTPIIQDTGETLVNGVPLLTFDFPYYTPPSMFDNPTSFGGGYPELAASGMIKMTCISNITKLYYPSIYNGSNSSTNPIPQYLKPSGFISWKVPKFQSDNKTYNDYSFAISYINSSGIVTGPTTIDFTSASLQALNTGSLTLGSSTGGLTLGDNLLGPNSITIDGNTGRYRVSIGVNDLNLITVQYNQVGTFVSTPYTNTDPIYAISLKTSESVKSVQGLNVWDIVKYYIQFNVTDNGQWYPISPKPRVNEVDASGKLVPNIYILDTNLLGQDTVSSLYNQVGFLTIGKEQYSFRIKITMDTSKSGTQGAWTPKIFDYRASVINRSAMLTANFNQYLFN